MNQWLRARFSFLFYYVYFKIFSRYTRRLTTYTLTTLERKLRYILLTLYGLIIDLYCISAILEALSVVADWVSLLTITISLFISSIYLTRSGQEHEHVALPRLKPNQSLVLEDYFYSGQCFPLGVLWAYRIANLY